jgi:hypothetical protein
MRAIAAAFIVFSVRAQTALPTDLDALSKIRTGMNFDLAHQPNYTFSSRSMPRIASRAAVSCSGVPK